MSLTILWKIPTDLNPNNTYDIRVYRSTSGEDGDYSLLGSTSAGGGNSTKSYTDSNGDTSYFYFVRYVPSGGSEGGRVLAVIEPSVTEQRLSEQVNGNLPEIIKARIDTDFIDIRKTLVNALSIANSYSPQTSYGFTNLPGRYETVVVLLTLALLYMEKHLQISIRDYTYGGTGISLNVDRGSKINASIAALMDSVNKMLDMAKNPDREIGPIGLGTEMLSVPSARIFSFLYGQ